MKKKLILFICLLFIGMCSVSASKKVNVYLFWGDGCPHCEKAKEFFNKYQNETKDLFELKEYEVWGSESNAALMQLVGSYFGEEAGGVPYIVIGDKTFMGYAESFDESIKDAINDLANQDDPFDVMKVININDTNVQETIPSEDPSTPNEKEEYVIDLYDDAKANTTSKTASFMEAYGLIICFGIELVFAVIIILQTITINNLKREIKKINHKK